MKILLNIGLNNNPYSIGAIKALLSQKTTILNSQLYDGFYKEPQEPTLVISLSFPDQKLSSVIQYIESLCIELTQECIPVLSDSFELLVYNPNYTGEKFKFDNQYFLTL